MKKNHHIATIYWTAFAMIIMYLNTAIGLLAKENQPRPGYPSQYINEQSFHEYTVRTRSDYEDEAGVGMVEIFHNTAMVYTHTVEGHLYIGYPGDEDPRYEAMIEMGTDITGTGIPNLVISEWTLGMHCCFYFYIFELGEQVQLIAKLDAGHSDRSHFEDVDGDGIPEFVTNDWTFAYWYASFATSPAPDIILRFTHGEYVLAFDLMRKSAPSPTEIHTKIEEVRHDTYWWEDWKQPPPCMWGFMLDCIYSGHETLAYEFFEHAWLPDIPGKELFLEEFRSRLRQSPYWAQIMELNRQFDLKRHDRKE